MNLCTQSLFRVAVALCLPLSGCFSAAPEITGRCMHNNDCSSGTLCDVASGFCTSACWGHADCPRAQVCQGYCVPHPVDCGSSAADCVDGTFCQAGECRKVLANAEGCHSDAQCLSGHCVDGVCCNDRCTGLCESCSIVENKFADGQCLAVALGVDMYDECPGQLACNGAGACFNAGSGDACEDHYQCVLGDCEQGQCTVCGDGLVTGNEQCDDGNTVDDGNGCDASCRANNVCGNGLIASAVESCDDGNTSPGDGCDNQCQIEPGWTCAGEPSMCVRLLRVHQASSAANPDGSTWENAFASLQEALQAAGEFPPEEAIEIWVAEGIYTPGPEPADTFTLSGTLALYGGFAGDEIFREERQPLTQPTVLSGLLGGGDALGSQSLHSYHIVTAVGFEQKILNGFVVQGGRADRDASNKGGGGVFADQAKLTVEECWFFDNRAEEGGAIRGGQSTTVINSVFVDNRAVRPVTTFSTSRGGGAILGAHSISFSSFAHNRSSLHGGAVENVSSVVSSHFHHNRAVGNGGALSNSWHLPLEIHNSTFNNNSAFRCGAVSGWLEAVIEDSIFTANRANLSGGALCLGEFGEGWLLTGERHIQLGNLIFMYNKAQHYGGAIQIGMPWWGFISHQAVLDNSWLEGNEAAYGGGISTAIFSLPSDAPSNSPQRELTITDTVLLSNRASEDGGAFYGITMMANRVHMLGNIAKWGGAVASYGFLITINNSLIANNRAAVGGGMFLQPLWLSPPVFELASGLILRHVTLAHNSVGAPTASPSNKGGGLRIDFDGNPASWAAITMRDSIFTANLSDGVEHNLQVIGPAAGNFLTINNSLVHSTLQSLGTDNITSAPGFVAPHEGNFHLHSSSPARNQSSFPREGGKDAAGRGQYGSKFDLGAFEYHPE